MCAPTAAESELIRLTREIVHNFYQGQYEKITSLLSGRFTFINGSNFDWPQAENHASYSGLKGLGKAPASIRNEHFALLGHEGDVWALYGHYFVSALSGENSPRLSHMRATFIWGQDGSRFALLHVHASRAVESQESPGPASPGQARAEKTDASILKRMEEPYRHSPVPRPLTVKDNKGTWHFLQPSHIHYIRVLNQKCIVHTWHGEIQTRSQLSALAEKLPNFVCPHRSFLANPLSISSLDKRQVTLVSGESLPVSRERYAKLRETLDALGIPFQYTSSSDGSKQPEEELSALTKEVIQAFGQRQAEKSYPLLSSRFVFIGSSDIHWTESLEEFQALCQKLADKTPLSLRDAVFRARLREGSLWVLCGRCVFDVVPEKGAAKSSTVYYTSVWLKTENEAKLLHLHGSCAADDQAKKAFLSAVGFEHLHAQPQIHYIQAANQWCVLFTDEGEYLLRSGLSTLREKFPDFICPHRSYLVNPAFIASLERYQLTLVSGEQLPISKTRYGTVKNQLGLKEEANERGEIL